MSQTATAASVLEEVRLTAFKSFREAALPLDELTLLVGRNGSGKSNALDGLWALTRLAQGDDVREALDGGRDGPAVRGGVAGCPPFGSSAFTLGCTVRTDEDIVELDLTVQTEPVVQVAAERLVGNGQELLATEPPETDSSDISARWESGKRGRKPPLRFRANHLLTTQVLSRVPATDAGRRVHLAAAQLLSALRSVFVLDPVPHEMRGYVPRRDVLLRREAGNLSAAVASLLESDESRRLLCEAMGRLNEQQVVDVTTSASDLDDVMLVLSERHGGQEHLVPARIMSDGSLRFLAILVALMQAPTVDTTPDALASDDAVGQTMVVIEELENGLHASQAATLIDFVRDQVTRRRVRTLATAHSPAVLDALHGDEHGHVVVCQRDSDGDSTLSRLVDLPNYWRIAAGGGLGRAAETDRLRADEPARDPVAVLDEVLGTSA